MSQQTAQQAKKPGAPGTQQPKNNVVQLEIKILNVLKKFPMGLPASEMAKELKGFTPLEQSEAINSLLVKGRMNIFKDVNGDMVYREIGEELAQKFAGLGMEDMLVYQIIESTGNMGIWSKDIRTKSKLQQVTVTKTLKLLESKKLIKSVKSINDRNKKLYMVFNVEPSIEITGGAWYSGDEFDTDFVTTIMHEVHKYILQKKYASTVQVSEYIRTSGLSTVDLRIEDVQCIINALMYDGLVEEVTDLRSDVSSLVFYKVASVPVPHNDYTDIPCATCPVFHECSEEGDISPGNCVYYTKWLEF